MASLLACRVGFTNPAAAGKRIEVQLQK